jgi:hypothetical protein
MQLHEKIAKDDCRYLEICALQACTLRIWSRNTWLGCAQGIVTIHRDT